MHELEWGPALEQLSDEEFWRYARKLASTINRARTGVIHHAPTEHLVCKLSRGYCLVPLTALYEVVQPPQGRHKTYPYTLLPAVPQWMLGLVAWRGETIAVIDLDAYLTGHPGAGQAAGAGLAPAL